MRALLSVVLATALAAPAMWAQEPAGMRPATELLDDQRPAKAPPKPITIDQALETAFRESPDIKTALAQIERAKGGVSEAGANFNPKFNGQLTYQRQGPKIAFDVPGIGSVSVVQEQNTVGQASVLLPLDINKKLSYISDIANYQFQIDYLGLVTASQKLIFDLKTAYFDLLRAQGQEEVAQAAVDVANARLKDATARYSVGAAPKYDVTRAQVDVSNLNQKLITAKSRVGAARAILNRVMGIDINAPTEVVRSELTVENIKVDIDRSIQEAYVKRPEVRSAQTLVGLAKKNVRLQRTGVLPSANVTGNYTYTFQVSGFSTENQSWIALMTLSVPIWDGGVTKARVDQAYADVERARQGVDSTELQVGQQVKVAALVLQEGIERVSTTTENVALAEETLRLATVRYNGGIGTMVEVIDAESALTQAKVDWVNARYDYVLGLAGLERSAGNQPELAKLQLLGEQSSPFIK